MCTATGAHAVPTPLGHRRRATVLCVFLAAAALSSAGLAPPAFAQGASSATLRGVVTDSSGGVLPGAEVTLVNVRTAGRRRATTGPAGTYVFVALASGDYRVKVGLAGLPAVGERRAAPQPRRQPGGRGAARGGRPDGTDGGDGRAQDGADRPGRARGAHHLAADPEPLDHQPGRDGAAQDPAGDGHPGPIDDGDRRLQHGRRQLPGQLQRQRQPRHGHQPRDRRLEDRGLRQQRRGHAQHEPGHGRGGEDPDEQLRRRVRRLARPGDGGDEGRLVGVPRLRLRLLSATGGSTRTTGRTTTPGCRSREAPTSTRASASRGRSSFPGPASTRTATSSSSSWATSTSTRSWTRARRSPSFPRSPSGRGTSASSWGARARTWPSPRSSRSRRGSRAKASRPRTTTSGPTSTRSARPS